MDESIVVTATVKSREELDDGWKLILDIPAFKSKYPTQIWGVPREAGLPLRPGATASMTLTRGKKVKDDSDGKAFWHWNWRFGGIAAPGYAPEAPAPPATRLGAKAEPSSESGGYRTDATGISIERQVSLKAAVELTIARIAAGHYGKDDKPTYHVAQVADFFARWLQGKVDVKTLGQAKPGPMAKELLDTFEEEPPPAVGEGDGPDA